MAHGREKFALGAAGRFRRFFGSSKFLQGVKVIGDFAFQLLCAIGDIDFKRLAGGFELLVAMANLLKHGVEAVDESPNLVVSGFRRFQGVVLFARHALGVLAKGDNGIGDGVVESQRKKVGHAQRDYHNARRDQGVTAKPGAEGDEIGAKVEGSNDFLVFAMLHGFEDVRAIVRDRIAVVRWKFREVGRAESRTNIGREKRAVEVEACGLHVKV